MSYAPKQTLKEGYEKFVIRNPIGCWDWSGCCPKNPGYGQFRYGMKIERAHRASWKIHFGDIPKGMFVCHKCDNKRCSKPEHLFLGTCKQNNHDAIDKKIHPTMGKSRDENHMTKVFTKDLNKIVELYKNGETQVAIAKKYGVSQKSISKVILQSQVVGY